MERGSMGTRPSYEYSIFVRFVVRGQLGPLGRHFFRSASGALDFIGQLQNNASLSICRREVGTWQSFERLDLEQDASEEAGR